VRAFYSDTFVLPLPDGHRFPMDKYRRVREHCLARGILPPERFSVPEAASWDQLRLVHDDDYVARVRAGALTAMQQRRIGFPWSPGMVERSRRSAGATIAAARTALAARAGARWGVAANLAGGTHHAYPDHGEGFCVFNDAAIAVRALQDEGMLRRAAIVDCDVHQGNGTAAIFAGDPTVFTFSIHGARNYPFRKERSDLDVALPDGAGDDAFLGALDLYLPRVLDDFAPDLVIYLAGADPFVDDRFGRLAMTKPGLAERDQMVLGACRRRGIPVAVAMAGGYARDTADIVDIHVETIRIAAALAEDDDPATSPPSRPGPDPLPGGPRPTL
jgi:acetoin utilization deacetylase AcuC-like enzyme